MRTRALVAIAVALLLGERRRAPRTRLPGVRGTEVRSNLAIAVYAALRSAGMEIPLP